MRVETVLGIGVQHSTLAASSDLLVHRVAIVFALRYLLQLFVSPLVGQLERQAKAALVFVPRSLGSQLRPRKLSPYYFSFTLAMRSNIRKNTSD